jgi:DNA-binding GntR family transcriptional regulator
MEVEQRLKPLLYEPNYAYLVRTLRGQIASGELRPYDRLPSESQLCKRFGVSPMTVRRAINILSAQDLVVTQKGRGTFVKSMRFWSATFSLEGLQCLFDDEAGTTIKLLEASIKQADESTARKLAIKAGLSVVYIRRLIYWQEKPYLYHWEYLVYDPLRPIVESEMEVTSLRGLFKETGGLSLKSSVIAIEAAVLSAEEARMLLSQAAAPAFHIEHIIYDFDGKPVSWGSFTCPGDRLRFSTIVGIHDKEQEENG